MNFVDLAKFINGLPKAELHLHIEGSLEPELLFELATRNDVSISYNSVEDLRKAYSFTNLQSFLDIYYGGASVLLKSQDFYDLTNAYVKRCLSENVRHAEIFFDPQTHLDRGVPISEVFSGIGTALRDAKRSFNFSSYIILCFLRHLSEESAFEALEAALSLRTDYTDLWVGIGLDSSESNNPPEKFARVYARCRELGFRLVAHAGEEGPPQYVTDSLDLLHVDRIDHGVRSEEDPVLMSRLLAQQIPLTVCPLSNLKLQVVKDMSQHNIARLLQAGLKVTVNSDDPAYFGGYVNANFLAVATALSMSKEDLVKLAKNSFEASFLPDSEKAIYVEEIDSYYAASCSSDM